MDRRNFLRWLGLGLAGVCTGGQFCWPRKGAAAPGLRLACLADAHLQNGDSRRPEAQSLARAVAELRSLDPAPQLVLFGGDLADQGNPLALALGREILADLPAPCLMVMGEGDGSPGNYAPWPRLFGDPWFSRTSTGLQILGLHTAWTPGPGEPLFRVGDAGQRWLARELDRLDPEIPLLLLSHAPLAPVFRPWQQWTLDGPEILARLHRFRQVLCLHGHTHNAGASGQWPVLSKGDNFAGIFPENRKRKAENVLHLSLPATAWPQPQAIQGTPALLAPGLGPCGCGWALLTVEAASFELQPQVWSA
ncbi:MAG: metallophosphoesterase [Deltaproteobacteria bacterium]|nr:metallophosphoesterase [Deltaproteobacteria bacterium]